MGSEWVLINKENGEKNISKEIIEKKSKAKNTTVSTWRGISV